MNQVGLELEYSLNYSLTSASRIKLKDLFQAHETKLIQLLLSRSFNTLFPISVYKKACLGIHLSSIWPKCCTYIKSFLLFNLKYLVPLEYPCSFCGLVRCIRQPSIEIHSGASIPFVVLLLRSNIHNHSPNWEVP